MPTITPPAGGRTWQHRCIGRRDYELEVDGNLGLLVSIQPLVEKPNSLIRKIVRITAEHHRDQFVLDGQRTGVDWKALGWDSQADHDELLDTVLARVDGWHGHPLETAALAYVAAEKAAAGIPHERPYSVDQLDALDRIVRRAPTIVAQDAAAEGAS